MSCNIQESVDALQKSLESGEDHFCILFPTDADVNGIKDKVLHMLNKMQLDFKALDVNKVGMGFTQDFHEWAVQTPTGRRYIEISMGQSMCGHHNELYLCMSTFSNRDE